MKIFQILSILVIFSACSPSGSDKKNPTLIIDNKNKSYEMEELTYLANNDTWDVASIDLSLNVGDSLSQTIRVSNNNKRGSITLTTSSLNGFGSEMAIETSTCENKTLGRRQSCYIRLALDASSLSEGEITGSLTVSNGTSIPIIVTVGAEVEEASPLLIDPTELDFGTFTKGDIQKILPISIRNRTRSALPINLSDFTNGEFSVESTTCGSSLNMMKQCLVYVEYVSPSEITEATTINDDFKISGNLITMTAELVAEPEPDLTCSIEQPSWVINGYTEEAGQRIIDLRSTDFVKLYVRNYTRKTRSLCINNQELDLSRVIHTECNDLKGYGVCYLDFNKLNGLDSDHEVKINGVSYLIKTDEPEGVACEEADASSNGFNISLYESIIGTKPIDNSDLSQCSISCPDGYSLDDGLKACVKSCEEADALANGVTIANVIDYKGSVTASDSSQCLINSCQAGYSVSGDEKSCIINNYACTESDAVENGVLIANVIAYKGNVVGTDKSQCLVSTCEAGHTISVDEKSCILNNYACTESDAVENGVNSSNVTDYKGNVIGTDKSQCLINSCESNYLLSGDEKSCNVIQCDMSNLGDVDNSNSAVLSVTGDYASGCQVDSCDSNYNIAGDSKSCEVIQCDMSNLGDVDNSNNAVLAVSGDYLNGCQVDSCNPNYNIAGDSKSCEAIQCTDLASLQAYDSNITENTVEIINISGDYANGCSYDCNAGFEISSNGCALEENTITLNMNYVGDGSIDITGGDISSCSSSQCLISVPQGNTLTLSPNYPTSYTNINYNNINCTNDGVCSFIPSSDEIISVDFSKLCEESDAIANGVSLSNYLSLEGDVLNASRFSCLISTCQEFYTVSIDQKSCEVEERACTAEDVGFSSLDNGTMEGTVVGSDNSSCSFTCNAFDAEEKGTSPNKYCEAVGSCTEKIYAIGWKGFAGVTKNKMVYSWGYPSSVGQYGRIAKVSYDYYRITSNEIYHTNDYALFQYKNTTDSYFGPRWRNIKNQYYYNAIDTIDKDDIVDMKFTSHYDVAVLDNTSKLSYFSGNGVVSFQQDYLNIKQVEVVRDSFVTVGYDGTVNVFPSGSDMEITNPTYGLDCDGLSGPLARGAVGNIECLGSNVEKIVNNNNAIAALKSDGTVVSWGYHPSTAYQSGYGAYNNTNVDRTNIVDVYAGGRAFAARKSNGTVVSWGYPNFGGVDYEGKNITGVVDIKGNNYGFVALKSNGVAISWGHNLPGGSFATSGISEIYSHPEGRNFVLKKTNNTLLNYGDYSFTSSNGLDCDGQGGLSRGSTSNQSCNNNISSVVVGPTGAAALRSDGKVFSWGDPDGGGASYIPPQTLETCN